VVKLKGVNLDGTKNGWDETTESRASEWEKKNREVCEGRSGGKRRPSGPNNILKLAA